MSFRIKASFSVISPVPATMISLFLKNTRCALPTRVFVFAVLSAQKAIPQPQDLLPLVCYSNIAFSVRLSAVTQRAGALLALLLTFFALFFPVALTTFMTCYVIFAYFCFLFIYPTRMWSKGFAISVLFGTLPLVTRMLPLKKKRKNQLNK